MSYTVNINFSRNDSVSISRKPDVFGKPVVSEERKATKKRILPVQTADMWRCRAARKKNGNSTEL